MDIPTLDRRLFFAAGAAAWAAPGAAAPLAPGQFERWWDDMLRAPIHLQAEMVARPAIGFGSGAPAVGEAVARRVFRGAEWLPEGARFRFTGEVAEGSWFLRPEAPPMPVRIPPPLFPLDPATLAPGARAELILQPDTDGPPNGFRVVFAGFRAVAAVGSPVLDPRQRPANYNRRFLPAEEIRPEPPRPRRVPEPADFPRRDAVVDYAVTQRGARSEASAAYHAASQRLRVTPRGRDAAAMGDLLLDRSALLVARLWERDGAFSLRPGRPEERYGHAIHRGGSRWTRAGEAVLAGMPCTEWHVTAGVAREARVWLTAEGLQLRRVEGDTVLEVSRAEFREVPVERVTIPAQWRRVPEEPGAWE